MATAGAADGGASQPVTPPELAAQRAQREATASGVKVGDDGSDMLEPKPATRAYRLRVGGGWAVQLSAFVLLLAFALVHSADFDADETAIALSAWAIAVFGTFTLLEPALAAFFAVVHHVSADCIGGI